jgi:hypothetical protein
MRRWERNRLLGRRAQEALAEENDGSAARRRHAVEAASAPGATLATSRPAQLTLPGIGEPAQP